MVTGGTLLIWRINVELVGVGLRVRRSNMTMFYST